ncbi:DsbC family protein [Geothermobacter hydrogeniphilus]|uniref:Uncharacterized protein n=1 Tax=Geothermobacter hydrogeniphilus TaxID=1969733 RepID=A0A1X0XXR1_9BACT|nr:DsbC family protein [Geothermobacter hydrogeniphilus]ORJ57578.1 hypothetical protein B5V00_13260 [Geothermobacter hydrogeniphilus]
MNLLLTLLCLLFLTSPAAAFMAEGGGCGAGECSDCHSLDIPEATRLLEGGVDKVVKVEFAEMPGVWLVEVERNGQTFPLYLDFSKKYLIAGNIIRLKDKTNITAAAQEKERPKVDVSRIPLDDALLLGNPMAATRVIVFTDPRCPYCKRLHGELKKVVKLDPNIAFLIKFFPLKMHPDAYGLAKTLICKKDISLLDKVFAGEEIPSAECEAAAAVDANLKLVKELGINSTPTMILPDGTVSSGAKPAAVLLKMLGSKVTAEQD